VYERRHHELHDLVAHLHDDRVVEMQCRGRVPLLELVSQKPCVHAVCAIGVTDCGGGVGGEVTRRGGVIRGDATFCMLPGVCVCVE
jgi:hypothetical protein